jgi:acyl-[acyl-carrier-protein]-phospholipid O-acyltransferase / long-chain-fatty-acid--[acyl-carrier-protein] ligase
LSWQEAIDARQNEHLARSGVALFFVCVQGAIFGPSKYGLLPELLPTTKLSWGNDVIELWTLLAAIGGTLTGGFLAHLFADSNNGPDFPDGAFAGGAAPDPARRYGWNWAKQFAEEIQRLTQDAVLLVSVIANTFFWFLVCCGTLCCTRQIFYRWTGRGADPCWRR